MSRIKKGEDFLPLTYIRLPQFIKVGKRNFCPLFSLHNIISIYMSCVRFCVRKIDRSVIDSKPNHYPHKVVIQLFLCPNLEIYKEIFKENYKEIHIVHFPSKKCIVTSTLIFYTKEGGDFAK